MTGEKPDTVLDYTGYDHSITLFRAYWTSIGVEKIYYLLFLNNKNIDWLNLSDINSRG